MNATLIAGRRQVIQSRLAKAREQRVISTHEENVLLVARLCSEFRGSALVRELVAEGFGSFSEAGDAVVQMGLGDVA